MDFGCFFMVSGWIRANSFGHHFMANEAIDISCSTL